MYLIKQITNDAKQRQTLILPNGNTTLTYLEYKPMQIGWFLTLTYLTFKVSNIRVVTSPNMLHQFKNIIPFGLACFVDQNQEPLLQDDFASGRAKLFILDSSELNIFDGILSGQITT